MDDLKKNETEVIISEKEKETEITTIHANEKEAEDPVPSKENELEVKQVKEELNKDDELNSKTENNIKKEKNSEKDKVEFNEDTFTDHNNIGNIDLLVNQIESLSTEFSSLSEKIENLDTNFPKQNITSQSISNIINEEIKKIQDEKNKKMRIFLYHVLGVVLFCFVSFFSIYFFCPLSNYYQKVRMERIKNDLIDPYYSEKINKLKSQIDEENEKQINDLSDKLKKEVKEEILKELENNKNE